MDILLECLVVLLLADNYHAYILGTPLYRCMFVTCYYN